ncbi:hypothetical protein DSECCO2_257680 [anaerobic digester metagenome]
MKRILFFLVGAVLSFNSFSQDYQKELIKDIVVIKGDKFTAVDYNLLSLSDGTTTYQIKSYAEAPTSVISRDNFVAFFTVIVYEMINNMTDDKEAKQTDLEEIIGNPDVEINCYMNKTGVQIEIKNANGTNRVTQKWSDFFKE